MEGNGMSMSHSPPASRISPDEEQQVQHQHMGQPPQPMLQQPQMMVQQQLSPPQVQHLQQMSPDHQQEPKIPRKRKKAEGEGPAEPRRLRRLHEACARCRRKKIKCDSKHPSCSACEAAGAECNQEDRHRQTVRPRGYSDLVESQLAKCIALLSKLIVGFKIEHIDHHMTQHGAALHVEQMHEDPFAAGPSTQHSSQYPPMPNYPVPQQHAGPSPSPSGSPYGATRPVQAPYTPTPYAASRPPYESNLRQLPPNQQDQQDPRGFPPPPNVKLHFPPAATPVVPLAPARRPVDPALAHMRDPESHVRPQYPQLTGAQVAAETRAAAADRVAVRPDKRDATILNDIKGQDPHSNDMSSPNGLIKAFGVSKAIVRDLKADPVEKEDILGGISQREAAFDEPLKPDHWMSIPLKRGTGSVPLFETREFYLPRQREQVSAVVDCYFDQLNPHRPIFMHEDFVTALDALYDTLEEGKPISPKYVDIASDSGFLCSVYLVLALGTLCVETQRLHNAQDALRPTWPGHEDFYDLALALKPDLTNSISTLQALILLHWYLYTERHGKSLWRIVGNLIRLAVELGLHHDPQEQTNVFTPEECHLRMRLWSICLIHDRGTSVIFGRPLGIQGADFNTPAPARYIRDRPAFSEHFELSWELTQIQAEIVNSLYRPGKLSGEDVIVRAVHIERRLHAFRLGLPATFQKLFSGTSSWTQESRVQLVLNVVDSDRGLTMLKYGIARVLLLRAVFNNKEVPSDVRFKALHDAVIMSHNVLILHAQLTSFPEIAFFVSPIPIHVGAMVILFASISKVETLPWTLAKEDVCLALKLVPLFRWRWTRKDCQGSHPLIVRLAQKVYGMDMMEGFGPISPPMLLDESYWIDNETLEGLDSPVMSKILSAPMPSVPPSQINMAMGQSVNARPPATASAPQHMQHDSSQGTYNQGGPSRQFYNGNGQGGNSQMDLDHTAGTSAAGSSAGAGAPGDAALDSYNQEDVAALMFQLADQQAPTDDRRGGRNDGSRGVSGAPFGDPPQGDNGVGHPTTGDQQLERFDVWNTGRRFPGNQSGGVP